MINEICISTISQKVLRLLAKYSDEEFHEREISRLLGISTGSANNALTSLFEKDVVSRTRKGKMLFYSINSANPAIPVFKKLLNILLLEPLVEQLKKFCSTIVLYGSCAQGNDISSSDFDIFIITNKKETVAKAIEDFQFGKGYEDLKIQPVIKSPLELLKARESDSVFLNEVDGGIVLWGNKLNE